jgi:hypothetical protein
MGYKKQKTKENKDKKKDRKPIKRQAHGQDWGGIATHKLAHRGACSSIRHKEYGDKTLLLALQKK